jgi:hypothetical protein
MVNRLVWNHPRGFNRVLATFPRKPSYLVRLFTRTFATGTRASIRVSRGLNGLQRWPTQMNSLSLCLKYPQTPYVRATLRIWKVMGVSPYLAVRNSVWFWQELSWRTPEYWFLTRPLQIWTLTLSSLSSKLSKTYAVTAQASLWRIRSTDTRNWLRGLLNWKWINENHTIKCPSKICRKWLTTSQPLEFFQKTLCLHSVDSSSLSISTS